MGIFSKKKTNNESTAICEEGLSYLGKDDAKAFEILMKAAEMKNEVAEFHIARMYETGKGVSKDRGVAIGWYADSVDDGCSVAAVYLLNIYVNGFDPEYDEDESMGLIDVIVSAGDRPFKAAGDLAYETAKMIIEGTGSFKDEEAGLRLMEAGALAGVKKCLEYR